MLNQISWLEEANSSLLSLFAKAGHVQVQLGQGKKKYQYFLVGKEWLIWRYKSLCGSLAVWPGSSSAFLIKNNFHIVFLLPHENICASYEYHNICLTHLSLASHKRDIGKQCRPRSDAAECRMWHLIRVYTVCIKYRYLYKTCNNKNWPGTPYIGNGLVRRMKVEESILHKWVKWRKKKTYIWIVLLSGAMSTDDPHGNELVKKNKEMSLLVFTPDMLNITITCLFKYIENFTTKKGKISDKKFWYFSYSCSKHRLWVPVRTTSLRQFLPKISVFEQK